MEINVINDLSNDIIFNRIETEAINKYCPFNLSINNKELLGFGDVNFSKAEISTFSNHSLTKSITLYHCFEYLINYSSRKTKDIINLDYIRYLNNYMNFIDLSKFSNYDAERIFKAILVDLLLIKLNEDEQTNDEFIKFIFDFLFYIISSKEKHIVIPFLIKALLKIMETTKDVEIINDETKQYLFDMNLMVFQNIFDCLYTSSLIRKNKIWEYVFNAERWIPVANEQKSSILFKNIKTDTIVNTLTYLEKAKKYISLHEYYLKTCKNILSKITEKNKDKYLIEFKERYDVIGYVFILHYLNDIKKYLKIVVK